jgi:hypothetical protein
LRKPVRRRLESNGLPFVEYIPQVVVCGLSGYPTMAQVICERRRKRHAAGNHIAYR